DHAWGTRAKGTEQVYEASAVEAKVTDDLTSGTYPLGKTGTKTVRFADDGVEVTIEHPGAFTEQVPLLLQEGDDVEASSGVERYDRVTVTHVGHVATVTEGPKVLDKKKVVTLGIAATDSLAYTIAVAK